MPAFPFTLAAASKKQSKYQQFGSRMTTKLIDYRGEDGKILFDHQIEAVLRAREQLLKDESDRFQKVLKYEEVGRLKPIIIQAPTGAGKTGMIFLLPYVLESEKVLILTPSKVISEQIGKAFGKDSKTKGFLERTLMVPENREDREEVLDLITEKTKIIEKPTDVTNEKRVDNVVIVNAQKFSGTSKISLLQNNRAIVEDVKDFLQKFDTLIVDEAHHYPAKTWYTLVREFDQVTDKQKKIIFLTATPFRVIKGEKTSVLGVDVNAFHRVVYKISRAELTGISLRECSFQPNDDVQQVEVERVYADIVAAFKENYERETRFIQQGMILVRKRDDATDWAENLNRCYENDTSFNPDWSRGVENFAIATLGNHPQTLQEFYDHEHGTGKYLIAVTCGIAKEGYDNPNVTVCVILRNVAKDSKILFQQFVGRCMRLRWGLGAEKDKSSGVVISYPEFNQKRLWDEMDTTMAEVDQEEVPSV